MNELYPFVETVTKNYSNEAANKLLQELAQYPGEKDGQQFSCAANEEYVIKRLITASLARDSDLKFNSYMALSLVLTHFPHLATLNPKAVADFVVAQSDIKKNCGGKPIEIQAYAIGKILIAKALKLVFKDSIEIINNLIELSKEHAGYEEQVIELVSQLACGKKAMLAFSKLSPQTKEGFVLFSILKSQLKGEQVELNESLIEDVTTELVPQYPKRSICLTYLGAKLSTFSDSPAKCLQTRFELALGNEAQDFDFKKIYYALQLFESHLACTVITKDNVWSMINPKLINSWLSQIRVQNKHIRKVAESIKFNFQVSHELAYEILKTLHTANVNLANINVKHPLFPLLQAVEPVTYFDYLLALCNLEASSMETEEEAVTMPIKELEIFISVANKDLPAESIAKAIELFTNNYHNNKDDTHLQALIYICNSLLPSSHKKKQPLLTKPSLILAKLSIEQLEVGENLAELKVAIKDIRKHFKEGKNEQDQLVVSYLNFLLGAGFYFLMYPEEVEIYQDLRLAFEDIKEKFVKEEEGPKKKRKLNSEEDKNKPIHVLVDIFISLLTKSPQFMRNSINHLFEQIMPYLDTQDLSHLFEVIQRPDQEYIEELQKQ